MWPFSEPTIQVMRPVVENGHVVRYHVWHVKKSVADCAQQLVGPAHVRWRSMMDVAYGWRAAEKDLLYLNSICPDKTRVPVRRRCDYCGTRSGFSVRHRCFSCGAPEP
jgi:hypothetical protein